jgi:hypothetical protein
LLWLSRTVTEEVTAMARAAAEVEEDICQYGSDTM